MFPKIPLNDHAALVKEYAYIIEAVINDYIDRGIFTSFHIKNDQSILDFYVKKVHQKLPLALLEASKTWSKQTFQLTFMVNVVDKVCRNIAITDYHNVIDCLVRRYIRAGSFKPHERKELVQLTAFNVLEREMIEGFQAKSKFLTYFWACVNNFLKEVYNKRKREDTNKGQGQTRLDGHIIGEMLRTPSLCEIPCADSYMDTDIDLDASRRRALAQIEAWVLMLPKLNVYKRTKLSLCLKIRAGLLITQKDVHAYWADCPPKLEQRFLACFGNKYDTMPKNELWRILSEFVNHYELAQNMIQQKKKTDALRVWVSNKTHKIKLFNKQD